MKFKGKEYTEVKDRLIAFADEFPQASIQTELVSVNQIIDSPTGETCNEYVVKATVNALAELRDANMVARNRGVSLDKVFNG